MKSSDGFIIVLPTDTGKSVFFILPTILVVE